MRSRILPVIFWSLCLVAHQVETGLGADFTVALFYGDPAPLDELKAFDVVVVEPDHDYAPEAYRTSHSELFAYVSIGEYTASRSYAKAIPDDWVAGKNDAWDAYVIDQRHEQWATFVTDQIIAPLWNKGYHGFFLDTLDSYHLVAKTPEHKQQQERGLIRVIQRIKTQYPDAKLIFNRGFEIIPMVAEHVYAVAAESLFRGWNQADKRYTDVPVDDRQWLLEQLQRLQTSYQLPIIIIDYLPPQDRSQARTVANKIQDLGMIPWVSTPELDYLGIGAIEVMPRKIISLFDGSRDPFPAHSDLHRFIDFPLNHLGYVSEHWDVRNPLPDHPLVGRYAGVVVWVSGDQHGWSQKLHQWLSKHIEQGVRVTFFDSFGFPLHQQNLALLGLEVGPPRDFVKKVKFSIKDSRMGYEIQPVPKRRGFFPLTLSPNFGGVSLLQVETEDGEHQDVVALMPWGGYALFPYAVIQLPDLEHSRWVFDPIEFLQQALRLDPMPVPDTTTQNGRRLLLIHVDGDGFASLAEMPGKVYAGEVLFKDVLRRYQVPTTVSIIEGEIGSKGLYPKLSRRLERAAKSMFALPHVELASHSFSHPFFWRDFIVLGAKKPGEYNLNVPNYEFGANSLKREITGSIAYINAQLAPPQKQVKVFLWTGDCDPPPEAVAQTYSIHVGNMNGGDTIMTEQNKSLTAVAAFGIKKNGHFQTYAPNQNENIYTNEWTGPFYGFEQVIETFELTDQPRRLKPINIYYHTYSASKKSALTALHRVYRWAMKQRSHPIYVSEYIKKVRDFNNIVVARSGHDWVVRGTHDLKELRIPQAMGYPDMLQSHGITGFFDHASERYLHISDQSEVSIRLKQTSPSLPYIQETNGQLLTWSRAGRSLSFSVQSYQPLTVSLVNVKKCQVIANAGHVENRQEGNILNLFVRKQRAKPISFTCS